MFSILKIGGDIVGFILSFGGQLVMEAFVDNSFMFYMPQEKVLMGVCKFQISLWMGTIWLLVLRPIYNVWYDMD